MLVFLDFEASSLAKKSYPIEVGWVFEDGRSASFRIRPAPDWTDWSEEAAAIHGIVRDELIAKGTPHDEVARQMVGELTGHDLLASAPSWDGKWLSALLRAAGYSRRTLQLRDSDEAMREIATAILAPVAHPDELDGIVAGLLRRCETLAAKAPPAHRALEDARAERAHWMMVRDAARSLAGKFASKSCD